jgi:hypothetical protein
MKGIERGLRIEGNFEIDIAVPIVPGKLHIWWGNVNVKKASITLKMAKPGV